MRSRRAFLRLAAGGAAVAAAGCATRRQHSDTPDAAAGPLVLISLDGFRWDYCDRYPDATPTLRALRAEGVTTRGLIPGFPSNTFPNHYSLVTGLYPSEHGVVNNDFFDAKEGAFFAYRRPAAVSDSRWWGGEPVWVTAERQQRTAAVSFWVGSEAEIKGVRPTFWRPFNPTLSFETRLDEVSSWLRLPPEKRPGLILFYLDEPNGAGHRFGPDAAETVAAVKTVDARVAALLSRIRAEQARPNVVIVSDHGMAAVDERKVVVLEEYLGNQWVQVEFDGPCAGLRPLDGDVAALLARLKGMPHVRVYRAEHLPPHFRMRVSPRVPPVWVVADEGGHVVKAATAQRMRTAYRPRTYLPGEHGYDPRLPSMHGLFIAHGPAFRRGVELPAMENVHVYNLLCAALGVQPAPNSGDNRLVRGALRAR